MKEIKLGLVIGAILAVLIVILQNTRVVEIRVFFWNISMSGILLYLILLIIGFIAGYLVARLMKPRSDL